MQWPQDLNDHIMALAVSDGQKQMATEIRTTFQPRQDGSTSNAYFVSNGDAPVMTIETRRAVRVPLPWILKPIYESYADTVEFAQPQTMLTFLSEREMLSRMDEGSGIVDFAYRYAGMGHVIVYTYDRETGAVLRGMDGGANGFEREANHRDRIQKWKQWKGKHQWPTSGSWWAKYDSFDQFWTKEIKEGEAIC